MHKDLPRFSLLTPPEAPLTYANLRQSHPGNTAAVMLYLFATPLSAMMTPRAPGASRASVIMAVPAPAAPVGLPKVGVMAVQGGFAAHLEALERQSSVEGVEVRSAEDLEGLDALILPGGESTAQGHILSRSGMLEATREFAATKTIVGFDIVEFNPFYDNKGQQTARLVRRIMLQFLTGISMKKNGMDPKWVNPRVSGDP